MKKEEGKGEKKIEMKGRREIGEKEEKKLSFSKRKTLKLLQSPKIRPYVASIPIFLIENLNYIFK